MSLRPPVVPAGFEISVSGGIKRALVAYHEGLELNHAQHFANYNPQQYGQPPPFDPYRQSTYTGTGSSPAFSALTPDGKIPFDGPPPAAMEKPPGDSVHLKIGRKKLWLILGSLAAVLVLGLSLGLGLGLGLSKSGDGSSSNAPASSTPSPSSTATPESSISCPTSNGTTFTSTTDPAKFDVYCAIDYNSNADANTRDLVHMEADIAEDCINLCAANDSCVGAGWGFYQPDTSVAGSNVCWLKSKLGTSHAAIQDWVFVIKQ
ncbi:hypothetical protein INS49_011976 [Diaporthe citri]|uniref:uncharacterized protein n=1 Tax=Diaporthe citri TaxID=83186 RepID=UPI001C7E3FD2|nr:uncharacterized protein INS49_011976 [Diaporthe citri]KAG6360908.1 hypothetical protein INS49_011976 [Diaporthe citri]